MALVEGNEIGLTLAAAGRTRPGTSTPASLLGDHRPYSACGGRYELLGAHRFMEVSLRILHRPSQSWLSWHEKQRLFDDV